MPGFHEHASDGRGAQPDLIPLAMTYLQFHLVFMLPPLALLAWRRSRSGRRLTDRALIPVAALSLIALIWTTPWDNYLVKRGVWVYGGDRVLGTIGYVPIEEYLFFLLQPVLLGLLYLDFESRIPRGRSGHRSARRLGGLAWMLIAVAGAVLLRWTPGTYLGLILVWAAPVLAGQWAWAGGEFVSRARPIALTVGAASLYLWGADRVAIGLGIWSIADAFTTGFQPFGLPVEEAVFFSLTSLLVVQGLVLFRHPPDSVTAGPSPDTKA